MEKEKYKLGDALEWETLNGTQHYGKIIDTDSNDAIVDCLYHVKKCVCSDII